MSPAAGSPATLIRVYRGAQQADAMAAFQRDSENFASRGYYPVSQAWTQGPWGSGARLIALLLMLIVHPVGTLTVTYALRETTASTSR
jgi:hypothetical protein